MLSSSAYLRPNRQFFFTGDSITAGTGTSPDTSISIQTKSARIGSQYDMFNSAISGAPSLQIFGNLDSYVFRKLKAGSRPLAWVMAGTNDKAGGLTPADTYVNLKAIWAQLNAWEVGVLACCLTRNTTDSSTVDAISTLILSDTSLYQHVFRFDQMDPSDTNLFQTADGTTGTHWTYNGTVFVRNTYVEPYLASLV